ncbi:unnamed protein product [Amoebophrya sp. A25]|nr:unnamed protein product [Amoebophrya sp. A25]|eukprot:GSA25T00005648001.1
MRFSHLSTATMSYSARVVAIAPRASASWIWTWTTLVLLLITITIAAYKVSADSRITPAAVYTSNHVAEYVLEYSEASGGEHTVKLFDDYADLWADRSSALSCWKRGKEEVFENYNACCVDDESSPILVKAQHRWPDALIPTMLQDYQRNPITRYPELHYTHIAKQGLATSARVEDIVDAGDDVIFRSTEKPTTTALPSDVPASDESMIEFEDGHAMEAPAWKENIPNILLSHISGNKPWQEWAFPMRRRRGKCAIPGAWEDFEEEKLTTGQLISRLLKSAYFDQEEPGNGSGEDGSGTKQGNQTQVRTSLEAAAESALATTNTSNVKGAASTPSSTTCSGSGSGTLDSCESEGGQLLASAPAADAVPESISTRVKKAMAEPDPKKRWKMLSKIVEKSNIRIERDSAFFKKCCDRAHATSIFRPRIVCAPKCHENLPRWHCGLWRLTR